MRRRDFLALAGSAAVAPSISASAGYPELVARVAQMQLAPSNYAKTEIWGFDGSVPGPEIRVKQGARVERRVINELAEPTAVHWHGIRIDNAMDGVPGMTQDAIPPGGDFDYSFKVPDAGTYWYHSHNRSWEQVARGLYGPLIVEEASPPDVDQDITLMIDDWRLDEDGALAGNFGAMHDNSHAGRLGNFATVNAQAETVFDVKTYERLRLRLINAANARVFELGVKGLVGHVVALDGMPLRVPEPLEQVTLAPAQRADVVVDVTALEGEEAVLFMQDREASYALVDFKVSGAATRAVRGTVAALAPNPVVTVGSLEGALEVPLVMAGGAMGGLQEASYKGEAMGMRELVAEGQVWAINGVAGMADAPLFRAERGQLVRLKFTNDTAFPHGMHLHGHHFYELGVDESLGALRDTTLLQPREMRDLVFAADNPGKWLVHCHMLGHQAAGLKTWFEVKA